MQSVRQGVYTPLVCWPTHCCKEVIAKEREPRSVGKEDHPEVRVDGDGGGEAA